MDTRVLIKAKLDTLYDTHREFVKTFPTLKIRGKEFVFLQKSGKRIAVKINDDRELIIKVGRLDMVDFYFAESTIKELASVIQQLTPTKTKRLIEVIDRATTWLEERIEGLKRYEANMLNTPEQKKALEALEEMSVIEALKY